MSGTISWFSKKRPSRPLKPSCGMPQSSRLSSSFSHSTAVPLSGTLSPSSGPIFSRWYSAGNTEPSE